MGGDSFQPVAHVLHWFDCMLRQPVFCLVRHAENWDPQLGKESELERETGTQVPWVLRTGEKGQESDLSQGIQCISSSILNYGTKA